MKPELVVPGVHRIEFEIGQSYIWDWDDGITVIDTGLAGHGSAIIDSLRQLKREPTDVQEILLTHFHPDHCGSAAELAKATGAEVIAHRKDAPVIRAELPQPPASLTEEEERLAAAIFPKVTPAPPVAVDRLVEDGDKTRGGATVVTVPGHTPGSIALHIPRLGLIFTGDTIASFEGEPILGPFNLDRLQAGASLTKLAAMDFDTACFGHGAPLLRGAQSRIRALSRRRSSRNSKDFSRR